MCRSRNMSSVKAITLVWDILEPMLFLHHDARPSLEKVWSFSIQLGHHTLWSIVQAISIP
jgi:hypothetical protein